MAAAIPQFVPDPAVLQLDRLGESLPDKRAQRPVDCDETQARVNASRPGMDVLHAARTPHRGQRAQHSPPLRRNAVPGGPQSAEPSLQPRSRHRSVPPHVDPLPLAPAAPVMQMKIIFIMPCTSLYRRGGTPVKGYAQSDERMIRRGTEAESS
jgi:hypothetical protein